MDYEALVSEIKSAAEPDAEVWELVKTLKVWRKREDGTGTAAVWVKFLNSGPNGQWKLEAEDQEGRTLESYGETWTEAVRYAHWDVLGWPQPRMT